ncbi:MmpS family membrane protein [Kocuria varians]
MVVVLLLFAGCVTLIGGAAKTVNDSIQSSAATSSADSKSSAGSADGKDQLKLDATASESASVSYGAGGSMSTADMTTTWTETVTAKTTDFYSVTVQDKSGASDAKVSCTLTRDGKKTKENSATGAYSIATCSDTP